MSTIHRSIRLTFSIILWILVTSTSVAVSANESKPYGTPTSPAGALVIGGPNQIEPTLFTVAERRQKPGSQLEIDVVWWPEGCKECTMSATLNKQTIFQNHDGSKGRLDTLTIGTTYRADALIFKNDSKHELSVLVLSK